MPAISLHREYHRQLSIIRFLLPVKARSRPRTCSCPSERRLCRRIRKALMTVLVGTVSTGGFVTLLSRAASLLARSRTFILNAFWHLQELYFLQCCFPLSNCQRFTFNEVEEWFRRVQRLECGNATLIAEGSPMNRRRTVTDVPRDNGL